MKKIVNVVKSILCTILIITLVVTMTPSFSSAAKKVKLNKTKVTLKVGKTTTLKLKNNKKKVKWSSSKKKVATVTQKGKVKAKKKGTTTITAKVGKKKYKCKVTVQAKKSTTKITSSPTPTAKPTPTPNVPLQSFSLNKTAVTIEYGKPAYITVLPYPSNATNIPDVVWESSNTDLVKVSATNNPLQVEVWTGYGLAGTETVTAKIGDMTATCKVTVPDVEAILELSEDGTTILNCTNSSSATIINIPDTVTTLGEDAIFYCYCVKTLEIPSSVTTLEKYALPGNLESVYIPPSVTQIDVIQYLPNTCTIYGESGSYIEEWAEDRFYFTFVPMSLEEFRNTKK